MIKLLCRVIFLPCMHESIYQDEDGRYYQTNYKNGKEYRYYLDKGQLPNDWWADIQALNPAAKERLGYPTQKPEALMERIIRAATKEGDIVLDAYCGCGTTVVAAQKLNRAWIGIDITYIAVDLIKQRLIDSYYLDQSGGGLKQAVRRFNEEVEVFGIPRDLQGARALAEETKGDRVRKEFEKWAVFTFGGVFFEKRGADQGIDGYCYILDQGPGGRIERIKVYLQVKSGKVGVKDVDRFAHVIDSEGAPMGVFISLKPPTKKMIQAVQVMPRYRNRLTGKEYPKLYIITVEDLLKGNLPDMPLSPRATKQAKTGPKDIKIEDMLD